MVHPSPHKFRLSMMYPASSWSKLSLSHFNNINNNNILPLTISYSNRQFCFSFFLSFSPQLSLLTGSYFVASSYIISLVNSACCQPSVWTPQIKRLGAWRRTIRCPSLSFPSYHTHFTHSTLLISLTLCFLSSRLLNITPCFCRLYSAVSTAVV